MNFWKVAGLIRQKRAVTVENMKPDVSASFFDEFVTRVVLPDLTKIRRNPVMAGQESISLIDNCMPHVLDSVQKVLGQTRWCLLFLLLIMINIF
jgi:hypothetical protein